MPAQHLYVVTIEYDEDGEVESMEIEVYAFSAEEAKAKAKSKWRNLLGGAGKVMSGAYKLLGIYATLKSVTGL